MLCKYSGYVSENRQVERHQCCPLEPRRDGGIDVKDQGIKCAKALDFRAFAGSAGKQLRGAESSVETYPRLSSKTP